MTFFTDQYKIMQNIIARSGSLDSIDLASELAKVNSIINGFKTRQEMDRMNSLYQASPQATGGTITPQPMSSTPTVGQGLNQPQNEPMMQGGKMNLP